MAENIFLAGSAAFVMFISLVLQVLTLNLTRKNIYLGVRILEEGRENKELRTLGNGFVKTNFIIGLPMIILLTFIIYTLNNIMVYLGSIFGFLIIIFFIYYYYNNKVKILKEKNNWLNTKKQEIIIDTNFSKEKTSKALPSSWWFIIPIVILIINIIINIHYYPFLPDRVPTHWGANGQINGYQNKAPILIFEMPLICLFLTVVMFISFKSIGWAKQELSGTNPEESKERNRIFRRTWSIFIIIGTIALNLLMTLGNLQIMQVSNLNSKASMIFVLGFSIIFIASSVFLSVKVGQGGSKLKFNTSKKQSSICNRDDDKYWLFANTIFYNPEDPAVFVEKRFGIGWTVNAGTTAGKVIYAGTILLLLVTIGISCMSAL